MRTERPVELDDHDLERIAAGWGKSATRARAVSRTRVGAPGYGAGYGAGRMRVTAMGARAAGGGCAGGSCGG